jgi:adenylosuccinate lyase
MFKSVRARLPELMNARDFVGRAPQQVDEFLAAVVKPILVKNQDRAETTELRV